MNITNEMLEAVERVIAKEHGSEVFDDDHKPNEYTDVERAQYRAEAEAALKAVAPFVDRELHTARKLAHRIGFHEGRERRS